MLPRQKRKSGASQSAANKLTNAIYHKLTEVVENMAALTEAQPLTDTTVLMVRNGKKVDTLRMDVYIDLWL